MNQHLLTAFVAFTNEEIYVFGLLLKKWNTSLTTKFSWLNVAFIRIWREFAGYFKMKIKKRKKVKKRDLNILHFSVAGDSFLNEIEVYLYLRKKYLHLRIVRYQS